MPVATPPIDLQEFAELAKPLVESGRYPDAAAVLTAAVNALTRQIEEEAKEAWLIAAINEGVASGVYEGDVFNDIRQRYGFPIKARG